MLSCITWGPNLHRGTVARAWGSRGLNWIKTLFVGSRRARLGQLIGAPAG